MGCVDLGWMLSVEVADHYASDIEQADVLH